MIRLRVGMLGLGLALALFWFIGLRVNHHAGILWFDAIAAVLSFGIAALIGDDRAADELHRSDGAGPAVVGFGLCAIWIAGMAAHQPGWVNWLNLLLGVAALGLGATAVRRHEPLVPARLRTRLPARLGMRSRGMP